MYNKPEFIGLWYGLSKLGVISALINTNLKSQSLIHSIKIANPKVVIYDAEFEEALVQVKSELNDMDIIKQGGDSSNVPTLEGLLKPHSDDFIQLEKLLDLYPNVIVLSDEVYEYITFENHHISVHHREKLRDRSVSISSFGKSFHITGWKIGYVVASEYLMKEIKKVHQFK